MNKTILVGIIGAIIIGIVTVLSAGTLIKNVNEGRESTLGSQEEPNEKESIPQGRSLSIEFDEKMGLSAP